MVKDDISQKKNGLGKQLTNLMEGGRKKEDGGEERVRERDQKQDIASKEKDLHPVITL